MAQSVTILKIKLNEISYELAETNRYMDINIDNKLTLLIQIDDLPCFICEKINVNNNQEYKTFYKKYERFFNDIDSLNLKLKVKSSDLLGIISKYINCIGCRTDTIKFFERLILRINNRSDTLSDEKILQKICAEKALDPMYIDSDGNLRLKEKFTTPSVIYLLFYIHGSKLSKIFENKPKSRCHLHSLNKIRYKSVDIELLWNTISIECMKDLLTIPIEYLNETIDLYLKKHKFCCDCRAKVFLAFDILTGKATSFDEYRYMPALYNGLKCCDEHIHIKCDKEFVTNLIKTAEAEMINGKTEKHAKTIDTAQEEVLKCIGVYLSETFHKVSVSMLTEERAWRMLFYICVNELKLSFETEFDKINRKQDLESILSEFHALDEKKKLNEKEKRKCQLKKKTNKKQHVDKTKETITYNEAVENIEEEELHDIFLKKCECNSKQFNNESPPLSPCTKNIKLTWDKKDIDTKNNNVDIVNSLKDCSCRSTSPINIISYWQQIQNSPLFDDIIDENIRITDEEKNEYFSNKKFYLKRLKEHRKKLNKKLLKFDTNNINIKPKF